MNGNIAESDKSVLAVIKALENANLLGAVDSNEFLQLVIDYFEDYLIDYDRN